MPSTDSPVLDLMVGMTADSLDASSLDGREVMLGRLAALVAMDAPPVSYLLNLGVAADLDIDERDVQGILVAVAPIVGTAHVASAAGNIARAFGFALELEELVDRQRDT